MGPAGTGRSCIDAGLMFDTDIRCTRGHHDVQRVKEMQVKVLKGGRKLRPPIQTCPNLQTTDIAAHRFSSTRTIQSTTRRLAGVQFNAFR